MENKNNPQILIIDDEGPIRNFLTKALEKKGLKPDTAIDGEEGINKINSNTYDFVITDLKMPKVSGDKVLSEIKNKKNGSIFVIGMSGTPWILGSHIFDAVLPKPFNIKELIKIIYENSK